MNGVQVGNEEQRSEYEVALMSSTKAAASDTKLIPTQEAIKLTRQKQFGASSEKSYADGSEQLSLLFNEARSMPNQRLKQKKMLL